MTNNYKNIETIYTKNAGYSHRWLNDENSSQQSSRAGQVSIRYRQEKCKIT